jgi:hypothetical protein
MTKSSIVASTILQNPAYHENKDATPGQGGWILLQNFDKNE